MKSSPTTLSLFTEVGRVIRSRMEQALPLPFSQCETLRMVGDLKEPNMRDVAGHFKITAPSATALVQELVRGGYMERKGNARDRRQVRLSLTRKGVQTLKGVTERRKRILSEILSSLGARDRADLNRILGKIIADA